MQFTTRHYVRTHGKAPKGQGGWAFQATTHDTAFDSERYGPVHTFYGTYTEAKSAARQSMDAKTVAVMG